MGQKDMDESSNFLSHFSERSSMELKENAPTV
jgi:hypothetical protein